MFELDLHGHNRGNGFGGNKEKTVDWLAACRYDERKGLPFRSFSKKTRRLCLLNDFSTWCEHYPFQAAHSLSDNHAKTGRWNTNNRFAARPNHPRPGCYEYSLPSAWTSIRLLEEICPNGVPKANICNRLSWFRFSVYRAIALGLRSSDDRWFFARLCRLEIARNLRVIAFHRWWYENGPALSCMQNKAFRMTAERRREHRTRVFWIYPFERPEGACELPTWKSSSECQRIWQSFFWGIASQEFREIGPERQAFPLIIAASRK